MKNKIIIGALIVFLIILAGIAFMCCNTFKPYWNDELCPECNIAITNAELYKKSQDKSATVLPFTYCYKALHRERCQREIFGEDEKGKPNPVNYDDTLKMNKYLQCLNELK